MFTEDEFKQWNKKLGLSDSAIEIIRRVRESEPSRRVGGGRTNVVGSYPSRKMGMSIQFESNKVELPGVYLKEHDNSVKEFYDQPPKIKLSYKSLKEKVITIYHTADYFVLHEDKAGWEEWKTEEELVQLAKDSPNRYVKINGKWHCPPGEEYAKQFGLQYWVKSSDEINVQIQRNIVFLEDYLLDNETEVLPEVIKKILAYIRENPGIPLADLLRTDGVEADDIYYLIARSKIYINLEEEVLSEPEYTHVFIDEQTALAYKTMTYRKKSPMFEDHTLEIAPGVKVIWKGKLWTIINVGEKSISLLSEEDIIHIPKDQFYNMVSEGRIKGVDTDIIKNTNAVINEKIAQASEKELQEANYRYKTILPALEGKKIKDICVVGLTSRTIRNWINAYMEAENQYGSGFIGLIPRTNLRGNRDPHLPEETLSKTVQFIEENETVTNQSMKVLYGKLQEYCKTHGIIVPSSKTFKKMIKCRHRYEHVLNTEGPRTAYQNEPFYWVLEPDTPRHGERPFEIAHLDHTEMDLETNHSVTGKNLGKVWLTLLVDAFSRRVLAFYITYDAPSYRSDMMVLRECVRRVNRLPQIIVTDNGKDFKSIYFQSLLAMFGVTHKIRPAHKARFGSIGERLFGTTMSQLIHNLKGNTKIMKNVRQVSKSVNPKNHAVWTLPALYELLKEYFYEFYDTQEHSALGESPRETFERGIVISGKRRFRFIPYNKDFMIMTLPPVKRGNGTAKVDPQRGVKVNYLYYYCDDFYKPDVSGTRVPVRYDPWNVGIVYCFVRKRWVMCYSQYYSVFKNRTETEIQIASEQLMKQKRDNAGKSGISARKLADFLSRAEVNEEILNQRILNAEMAPQLHVIQGGFEVHKIDEPEYVNEHDFNEDEEINFDLDDDL
ncbi:DDE-type integrase/transposase/recombinase [Desulfosporosinus sp. FKB]|uniref:DDE-type integrase/transposase/recombinase n=1 Tax=Desulfosporosinus sp. FKB TaxID=1969835 RepID=UPI000B49E080|nr:DDE-type integrase/transposase/recombinase [Desulfosporosinus sp. FKB]